MSIASRWKTSHPREGEDVGTFEAANRTLVSRELTLAEAYASHAPFTRQWPRLLRGAATAALADALPGAAAGPPAVVETIRDCLTGAETGVPSADSATPSYEARESDEAHYFESRQGNAAEGWVHRSRLKK